MNVDIVIATGIFVVMVTLLLYLTLQYISQLPTISKVSEYREKAKNVFEKIFEKEGSPTDWEEEVVPSEIGVKKRLYRMPIVIEDTSGINRINEIVKVTLTFDEDCENKTWNNTVRIFDESLNEVPFRFVSQTFCTDNYILNATLVLKVNVSANSKKKLFVYYSNDKNIPAPNYTNWDLVLYLPFDEGSGTYTHDYSGNNNIGVFYNGSTICSNGDCPTWINGKFGKAVDFDGIDDYINVEEQTNLDGFSEITISAWVKPDKDYSGDQPNGWYGGFWKKHNSYSIGWQGWTDGLTASFFNSSGIRFFSDTDIDLYTGNWYYIVVTFDSQMIKYYINGEYITGGLTGGSYFGALNDNSYPVKIGLGFSKYFNGTVDEFYIYKRVLTNEEIISHNASTPLSVRTFPPQELDLISPSKLNALRTIDYEKVKSILGEEYEFRIEVNPVED